MKSYSLIQKFLISAIPMMLAVLGNAYFIYHKASTIDEENLKAAKILELTVGADLAMTQMSEHLRGYLLSGDHVEYDLKKKADEKYGQAISELITQLGGYPETQAIATKMQILDEEQLDPAENEVAEMIKGKDPKAKDLYYQKYTPLRSMQNKNFEELRNKVKGHADELLQLAHQNDVGDAFKAIMGLFLSGAIVFAFMIWVMKSSVKTITDVTHKLKLSSADLNKASHSISSAAVQLSEASAEQAASLQETASALDQISSMVGKSTDNAKKTNEAAEKTKSRADDGKTTIHEMLSSIEEINKSNESIQVQVTKSNEQMSEIIQIIQEIGSKTKVINDIVFQTKLLSFNASVEAARAGEHGKGFAVVAEEVGNLAAMSGSSAHEISEMLSQSIQKVESIVAESRETIEKLVTQSKEKVSSGIETAQKCEKVFEEIYNDIIDVSKMSEEISVASAEQARGINEINTAIGQLDSVTQQNTATSAQSATSAKGLSHGASDLELIVSTLIAAIEGDKSKTQMLAKSKEIPLPKVKVAPEVKNEIKSQQKVTAEQKKIETKQASTNKESTNPTQSSSEVPDHNHSGFIDV